MFPGSQVSWAYDYAPYPNASDNNGPYPLPSAQNNNYTLRFIPLLFNGGETAAQEWPAYVESAIVNYNADALFSFNEPDAAYSGLSANMAVSEALAAYKRSIQPFANRTLPSGAKLLLGSPSITNAGQGLTWLSEFLGNASLPQYNLTVDFINIHFYASPYNFELFKEFITSAYDLGERKLPVWVTEFGVSDEYPWHDSSVVPFIKNCTTWLDEQPWVERYAWFGAYPNNIINAGGSGLNARGRFYANWTGGYSPGPNNAIA